MELFKRLDKVMSEGNTLNITIAKGKDGFTVSAIPGNDMVKDAAKNRIQPLNFTGNAEDFDNGFEDALTAPIEKSFGLLSNMQSFEESVEEARKQSEMEKKAKESENKKKSDLEGWLKLAEKNIADSKFKDARICEAEAEKLCDKTKQGLPQNVAKVKARIEEADGGLFKDANADKSDGAFTTLAALKKLDTKDEKKPDEEKADTSEEEDNDNEDNE